MGGRRKAQASPPVAELISASNDKTLKVWDLASGRAEATLEGHADKVTACAVTQTDGG